jgi:hypothetical protein
VGKLDLKEVMSAISIAVSAIVVIAGWIFVRWKKCGVEYASLVSQAGK